MHAFVLEQVVVRRGTRKVLDGVSADIPDGTCTVLRGSSGAGKSTLLRLLNRLEDPSEGRILHHGRHLPTLDVLELRRRVSLVGQQPVLLTVMVREELAVGRPDLTDDEAAELLHRVGLPAEMCARRTDGLSGGEAQRVCLARALAVQPQVLLLDEPTAALDSVSAGAIEALVRDWRGTVVFVTHNTALGNRLADQEIAL